MLIFLSRCVLSSDQVLLSCSETCIGCLMVSVTLCVIPTAIHLWNSLPENIVSVPELNNFCEQFDMHYNLI